MSKRIDFVKSNKKTFIKILLNFKLLKNKKIF